MTLTYVDFLSKSHELKMYWQIYNEFESNFAPYIDPNNLVVQTSAIVDSVFDGVTDETAALAENKHETISGTCNTAFINDSVNDSDYGLGFYH
jgi:hypothetical protein